ncbi:MAG: hypothetical protein RUDDFDWM_001035 [Candidatus Fervidibacterota bacterium]
MRRERSSLRISFALRVVVILFFMLTHSFVWCANKRPVIETYLDVSAIRQGSSGRLMVLVKLPKGLHVNSNKPKEKWLIPTTLTIASPKWLSVKGVHYPKAKSLHTSLGELFVYEGEFAIFVVLHASTDAPIGRHNITATLRYQACDERRCYPPDNFKFTITINIAGREASVFQINNDLFRKYANQVEEFQHLPSKMQRLSGVSALDHVSSLVQRFGWGVTLVIIFAFGLALNLTPCVFPLVPITVGYFASRSHGNLLRLLSEALLYALGIIITYSAMGTIAGLSGSLLGSLLQHPVTLVFVSSVIAFLGFGMLGLYEFKVPSSFLGRLHNFACASGSFGLGMIAGLIAAPCVGPFTAALLTFVAATGKAFIGFICFFVLSLGLSMPYIFLAVFSGALHRLPKSGMWMEWVRRILGFCLFFLAAYLLLPLMPQIVAPFVLPSLFLIASIYLGWSIAHGDEKKVFSLLRRATGIALFIVALGTFIHAGYSLGYEHGYSAALKHGGSTASVWEEFSPSRLKEALMHGKPILVEFTAKWCPQCKKLERKVLLDSDVINELRRFVCFRVDMTFWSASSNELARKYGVVGLPTILFITSSGEEARHLRIEGFVDKEELLERLRQLR